MNEEGEPELMHSRCECSNCGGSIEFPDAMDGAKIVCPHCEQNTVVFKPPPVVETSKTTSKPEAFNLRTRCSRKRQYILDIRSRTSYPAVRLSVNLVAGAWIIIWTFGLIGTILNLFMPDLMPGETGVYDYLMVLFFGFMVLLGVAVGQFVNMLVDYVDASIESCMEFKTSK